MMRLKAPTYIYINNVLKLERNFNVKVIVAEAIPRFCIHSQLPYFINKWNLQGLDNYNIGNHRKLIIIPLTMRLRHGL